MMYRTPWLIVAPLSPEGYPLKQGIKLYKLQMQNGENSRVLMEYRWGLGPEYARSCIAKRLELSLFIGASAALQPWLRGLVASLEGWQGHC